MSTLDRAGFWQHLPVLVTGGGGFIGSHLVDGLVALGASVRVLDSFVTGCRENLAESLGAIELVEGDLRDPAAVAAAVGEGGGRARVVFHLAALGSVPRSLADPLRSHAVNATGTLRLLEALGAAWRGAPGPARLVLTSSSSVYGDAPGAVARRETLRPDPRSPYAASKVAAEAYVAAYHHLEVPVEGVIVRLFNVYGARQSPASRYAAVVPRFLERVCAGEPPVIHGDGEQRRDFTHVSDVVEGLLLAGSRPGAAGTTFNLGASEPRTVNELAELVLAACDREQALRPRHEPPRPGDVRYSHACIAQARSVLGWQPRVRLEEGVARVARSWAPPESGVGVDG
jgi:UDP-glucose 4-epimerase